MGWEPLNMFVTQPSYSPLFAQVALPLALALSSSGCTPESCVHLEYSSSDPNAEPLTAVSFDWSLIAMRLRRFPPGSEYTACRPGDFADVGAETMTLLFSLNGKRIAWQRAADWIQVKKPPAEYEVLIKIDADGNVTEQHCQEPCSIQSE